MRRVLSLLTIYVLVLATSPSFATSGAHFFHDTSASVTDAGALSIFIDEAGVGQNTVSYTFSGTGTAVYACLNGGGNHPKASNKETVSSTIDFTAQENPINGRVEFQVTVATPSPGSFTCPSGQTMVLASASYAVTVTDVTNDATVSLSASRTFFII